MPNIALQLDAMINDLRESLQVEIKNWLNGLNEAADKARLAKEIIALANNGGGFIFIGFEDAEPHNPIPPGENDRRGYTQDGIASLVNSYVTPPCQCEIHFVSQRDQDLMHPVIVVPGEHRTPVFANRGAPENGILDNGKVYVRRPGGNSEHARTQDDWERLLDRLVKSRQADQLNAIRAILNPSAPAEVPLERNQLLDTWVDESIQAWGRYTDNLPQDDLRRFSTGYWYAAYRIHPFDEPSLVNLSDQLDRNMPNYSGWPPFTFLHRDDRRPRPMGNVIEAWLGEGGHWEHSDFWRVSRSGFGFLLRPMQEDRADYGQNILPAPPRPVFDWVLPIYRITEILRFIEALALWGGGQESAFDLRIVYNGTNGRTLWRVDEHYWLDAQGPCLVPSLTSQISANVSEIEFNLNELVWRLLQPIYEQFNFARLERALVDQVVARVHDYRRQFGGGN